MLDNTTAQTAMTSGTTPSYSGADPAMLAAEAWFERCMARVRVSGRFAEFITITPPMAQALLRRNDGNRALVASGVKAWSDALRAGDWEENGEAIIVADTGELNDGQHRLTAVVETGIPLPTLIVFGVSRDSRKTVDSGKKRTAAHILGMAGHAHGTLLASALKVLINLERGLWLTTHHSAKEIERALEAHPGIKDGTWIPSKAARQFRQSAGLFVALHYQMARWHPKKADEFFTMLADGTAPNKTHPVAVLRARLTQELRNKARLPLQEVAALIIKAWNAFVAGKPVTTLRWRTEGDKPEPFPQVR